MEDWLDLNTFEYTIECSACNAKLVIIQHGVQLNPSILNRILMEAHVKNTYDSYSYYHVAEKIIRIEADILYNKKCNF